MSVLFAFVLFSLEKYLSFDMILQVSVYCGLLTAFSLRFIFSKTKIIPFQKTTVIVVYSRKRNNQEHLGKFSGPISQMENRSESSGHDYSTMLPSIFSQAIITLNESFCYFISKIYLNLQQTQKLLVNKYLFMKFQNISNIH